jgi:antitoxin ParD1/3/4
MASTLNIQLTDALREYVDERASEKDVHATPSEYIRDLIRQDMLDRGVAMSMLDGLNDLERGRLSSKPILDVKDED